jgi:hypothetical protein
VEPTELDALVARGRIVPATAVGTFSMPPGPVDDAIDSADVISEFREDRL